METLAAQPHAYQRETFDRYLRTYNDTATWLAETLDASMRTAFEFTFDGQNAIAEDGTNMRTVLQKSLDDAHALAARNPQFGFEVRRRQLELEEYEATLAMMRGNGTNALVVVSDFPPELMHAAEDVGGYNVTRKQTMLRVLTWDGQKLSMYSQSLDGSNRSALETMYEQFGCKPQPGELLGQRLALTLPTEDLASLTDTLTGVYDRSLQAQYGGNWHAGRREPPRDTYQFVLGQHQLLDHFAQRFMYHAPADEERYNIAALIEKRFNAAPAAHITATESDVVFGGFTARNIEAQLWHAGAEARAAGRTYSGCGVSVRAQGAEDQLAEAGYGNRSTEDEDGDCDFISKECPMCHTKNVRTIVKKLHSGKKRIEGKCGCVKTA